MAGSQSNKDLQPPNCLGMKSAMLVITSAQEFTEEFPVKEAEKDIAHIIEYTVGFKLEHQAYVASFIASLTQITAKLIVDFEAEYPISSENRRF